MSLELETPVKSVVDSAVAKCGDIATLPEVTAKIIQLVEDPKSTARDMHEVIKTDPALSTRVLKVVNSAFYGLPGQISSIDRAIVLLGLSAVKNIAIAASIARMFKGQQIGGGFTAKDLWRHSVAVGVCGRLIARHTRYNGPEDEVFLSGLIHDVGVMVLRQSAPEKLTEVIERWLSGCGSYLSLETDIVGADHQALGNGLTSKWKFPRNLRAVVGLHHHPERISEEMRPLANIIRTADIICCAQKIGFHLTAAGEEVSEELLASIKLAPDDVPTITESLVAEVESAEAMLSAE